MDANSRQENLPNSRLPKFSLEEVQSLRGAADFFGLNYFTSKLVEEGTDDSTPTPSYQRDRNVIESYDPNWPVASSEWLRSAPEGLRGILK